MKILSVYFKNINSLEGENRIDFDKSPIAEAGVFAITGANGSGKSSILDAITLALYGQTFRFNKPAAHVMTKGTLGCFSQVEFLVDGERYRSSWQAMREGEDSDIGVSQISINMSLADVVNDLTVIEQGESAVLAKNEYLIGMDFRRFTRSIILEQGNFSAFLNALDAERIDILERIISHDIYQDYKDALTKQVKQAEQAFSDLQKQLQSVDVLSDSQYEALALDLADQQVILEELKAEKTHLLQLQAQWDSVQTLERNKATLETQQLKDSQELEHIKQELALTESSEDALVFDQPLAQISEQQKQAQQLEAKIAEQQQNIAIYRRD